jgi:pimeloyl-ACP methyl ester carboxylesterase
MGRDGSSGWHRERHSMLEVQATNAALDAIKKRYGFDGFNVYGHSGGAMLAAGLLSLRQDIGCAVLADGWLSTGAPARPSDPAKLYFDAVTQIAPIARNRAKILVVSDPQDAIVTVETQTPFIAAIRKAGWRAEQFFVYATDEEHHFTTPHAEVVMNGCLRGASHDEIVSDLAQLEVKLLAAKARAEALAGVRIADARPPVPGRPLDGINLLGADYSNFWVPEANSARCQTACKSDLKCAAWTYVQPGVLGAAQARCWLKDHVPNQYRNACCVSGVEKH